jgi:hypothetical protein
MNFTVGVSKELIKDMDIIIENFVAKYREDVIAVEAFAICLQTLIDKRDEIQDMLEESENE